MNKERCNKVSVPHQWRRVFKAACDNHRSSMKVRPSEKAWFQGRRSMALEVLHAALGRRRVSAYLL